MSLPAQNDIVHLIVADVSSFGKDGVRDHNQLIADMMLDVVKRNLEGEHKKLLMQEVRQLPFHNSEIIRQIFNWCLSGKSREYPSEFFKRAVVGYLEKNLRLIGFQRDRTGSMEREAGETREECSWLEINCSVNNQMAEGAVYVPKPSCLGKSTSDMLMCVDAHPGNMEQLPERKLQIIQKAQRHRWSLDNLTRLSPGCRNILKLFAYQIKPFPFYITEAVEYCRLLEYLIDHRKGQRWMSNTILVHILQDVVEGLIYMAERRMVTRDVTAYNMMVEIHKDNWRSSRESASRTLSMGNFTVKIAGFGLACQLPAGAAHTKSKDIHFGAHPRTS